MEKSCWELFSTRYFFRLISWVWFATPPVNQTLIFAGPLQYTLNMMEALKGLIAIFFVPGDTLG